MKKSLIFLFLLILLSFSVSAQILGDIEKIQEDLKTYSGLTLSEDDVDKIVVVEGNNLNLIEKAALKLAYKEYPALRDARKISDDEAGLEELKQTDKIIVFVGGPSQNSLAKYYLDEVNDSVRKDYDFAAGAYGDKLVVLSDKRGFANLEREAVKNSPLANIMPVEYVPLGAAGISVLFLLLFELITSYFEGFIEKFRKRRKQIKERFIGFSIGKAPIRFREFLAVVLGSLIFALAVTYTFVAKTGGFINVLKISAIVCLGIFILQEIPRIIISGKKRTLTEFVLYPLGMIVTLLSAFLGSVFGHPGRWLFKNEEYSGKIYYSMMVFVFLLGIVFFILNLMKPSIALQLAFTIASTVSVFEMLPFKPLNGREIFKWRPKKWAITFILFLPIYVLMNFFL